MAVTASYIRWFRAGPRHVWRRTNRLLFWLDQVALFTVRRPPGLELTSLNNFVDWSVIIECDVDRVVSQSILSPAASVEGRLRLYPDPRRADCSLRLKSSIGDSAATQLRSWFSEDNWGLVPLTDRIVCTMICLPSILGPLKACQLVQAGIQDSSQIMASASGSHFDVLHILSEAATWSERNESVSLQKAPM